ncbi:MAG TPA: hypothetical protein VFQ50_05255 [Flavobacterium sp.]|jgi:hypothetical protein|nr:hypothetical protein [Flavobacterium sp.]
MKEKIAIVETLIDKAEDYAKTTYALYRLKAIDKGAAAASSATAGILIAFILLFFLIFISAGLALYLGEVFGKPHYGFMAVAGIYFLLGLILIIFRKQLLIDVFTNMLINNFFKEKDDASNKE